MHDNLTSGLLADADANAYADMRSQYAVDRRMPTWTSPKNIAKALQNGDGFWEDERWSPIQLTAKSGTEYDGREITVVWQIEFDLSEDDFEAANAKLAEMEIEQDGYGWGDLAEPG